MDHLYCNASVDLNNYSAILAQK